MVLPANQKQKFPDYNKLASFVAKMGWGYAPQHVVLPASWKVQDYGSLACRVVKRLGDGLPKYGLTSNRIHVNTG